MEEAAGGAEMAVVQESGTVTEQVFDRMVVKTADLGIRSEDVRGSAEEARLVAGRFGGEVLSSRVYAGSGPVSAELVLSVPSGEFEAALDELRGLGNRVTTDTVEGQDVTEEFVDLESRERNLLAAEESLLTLYDRAESVEGTLTVERELTDIRGQIEEAQGRIQYLERRTATSEIILHLEPVVTAPPQQTWSPSAVAARAWDASLGVLQAAATAFISAVVFCWWLLPPLAVGLLLWRRGRVTSTSG
jgi:nucleotide-binding universal stress UspA family protein